jgi:lipopolysaccharide transport system ATP-binding protein
MNSNIVLRVNEVSKCYKIYTNPWHRTREWISVRKRKYHQPFWSLKNVSFEVNRGEILGIIGHNGAGKSTLLKIITGVIQPTIGSYKLNGKILSLLELGTDFNEYLTGRENVLRSAELLGFPENYIQERLQDITDFAELGDFFDRRVMLYSSGMKARLAFSLFAFLDCDILILDEVFAVGDIFFRQKCYDRLEKLVAKNTSIILVTHDMGAVNHYCNRVILLNQGEVICESNASECIRTFYQLKHSSSARLKSQTQKIEKSEVKPTLDYKQTFWPDDEAFTSVSSQDSGKAKLTRFAICNSRGEFTLNFGEGEEANLYCEFEVKENIGVPIVHLQITNKFNVEIHGKTSLHHRVQTPLNVSPDNYIRFSRNINLNIAAGEYIFGFSLYTIHPEDYAQLPQMTGEEIMEKVEALCVQEKLGYFQVTVPEYQLVSSHFGLCDLPGDGYMQVVEKID